MPRLFCARALRLLGRTARPPGGFRVVLWHPPRPPRGQGSRGQLGRGRGPGRPLAGTTTREHRGPPRPGERARTARRSSSAPRQLPASASSRSAAMGSSVTSASAGSGSRRVGRRRRGGGRGAHRDRRARRKRPRQVVLAPQRAIARNVSPARVRPLAIAAAKYSRNRSTATGPASTITAGSATAAAPGRSISARPARRRRHQHLAHLEDLSPFPTRSSKRS